MKSGERRVVITGLGVASPLGIGSAAFWDALMERRSVVRRITAFDPSTLMSRIGGEMPDFQLRDYIPKSHRKSVKLMSRDITLAVVAAHVAAMDAKLPTRSLVDRGDLEAGDLDPTRLGVNIGAGLICPDLSELGEAFATALDDSGQFDLKRWGRDGINNLTPIWLLKYLPNMLACHVSIIHDAQAMSNTVTCGEAASHLAVGEAYRTIARGMMDVCICGGAESKLNPMTATRPALMNRLVTDGDDDPAAACRPFNAERRGTVVSEGGGLLVLESLEHAQKRGARIYGELVGFGCAANTYSWIDPDPTGANIALAIKNSLADANLSPADIDLAGLCATGCVEHDASEMVGWRSVFDDAEKVDCAAVAVKGGLGNNGAGAGGIDLCAAVLAMHNNTVPPSVNVDPVDEQCPFAFAGNDPIDRRIDVLVSVAYALGGGQSAALVIRKVTE